MHYFSDDNDLDYVELTRELKHVLPFCAMLKEINNTLHRGYTA